MSRELGVKRVIVFCLVISAFTAHYQGEYDLSLSRAGECLGIAKDLEFPLVVAYAKEALGMSVFAQGELVHAEELFKEALENFRKIGDLRNVANNLVGLARIAYRKDDLPSASRYLAESLSLSRKLDIRWSLAYSLEIQGLIHRSRGNYGRAYELFQESLALSWQQGNLQGIANCLGAIAGLDVMTGQFTRSARLFAAAEVLRNDMGMKMGKDDKREYEACLSRLRDQMDEDMFTALWSEGSKMPLEKVFQDLGVLEEESG